MTGSNPGRAKALRQEVEARLIPRLYVQGFQQHPSPLAHFGWSPGIQFFTYDLVRRADNQSIDLLTILIDAPRMSVYLDFALLKGSFGEDAISEIVKRHDIKTANSVGYHDICLRFCRPNSWLPFGRLYRLHGRFDEWIVRNSKRLINEIIKDLDSLPQFLENNEEKRRLIADSPA